MQEVTGKSTSGSQDWNGNHSNGEWGRERALAYSVTSYWGWGLIKQEKEWKNWNRMIIAEDVVRFR